MNKFLEKLASMQIGMLAAQGKGVIRQVGALSPTKKIPNQMLQVMSQTGDPKVRRAATGALNLENKGLKATK